jgi:peroxiredoxin
VKTHSDPRLPELGYGRVGVSPDRPEQNTDLGENLGLDIPLLSDDGLARTRRFGIV